MDERMARILRSGVNCAYNAGSITEAEWFDALDYIAQNEDN